MFQSTIFNVLYSTVHQLSLLTSVFGPWNLIVLLSALMFCTVTVWTWTVLASASTNSITGGMIRTPAMSPSILSVVRFLYQRFLHYSNVQMCKFYSLFVLGLFKFRVQCCCQVFRSLMIIYFVTKHSKIYNYNLLFKKTCLLKNNNLVCIWAYC